MALSRINTNQIVDGAVATADIADGLITTAKLADGAVTTAKITDGNISTSKLADDAVTTAKVNPTQTDITQVGTLTSFASTGIDDNASSEMLNLEQNANSTTSKMLMVGENNNINNWSFNGRSGIVIEGTANALLALGRSSTAGQSAYIYHDGTLGITNQEATNINIGYNTGTAIAITSDRYVTKPNQPCFSAYISSGGHSFVVGDTTPETIVFNAEHFDTTNSHSNGIFTAPVAGRYFFNSTISFYGTDSLRMHDFAWAWYVNNSAHITQEIGNYIQESGASEFNTLSISTIISLTANQNVRTKMYSFGSPYLAGKVNIPTGTRSGWSGFLIG